MKRGLNKASKTKRGTDGQPNLTINHPLSRLKALKRLNGLVQVASYRVQYRYTSNRDRLAWSRVLVSTLAAAGPLLRDADLDELKQRVEELEKAAKYKEVP